MTQIIVRFQEAKDARAHKLRLREMELEFDERKHKAQQEFMAMLIKELRKN